MIEAFALDASVAISWCFPNDPTENSPYCQSVLDLLIESEAIVPEIWPFEIANSIFVSVSKRKRISHEQAQKYVDLITSLPIRVDRRFWVEHLGLESLARKHGLTAYDAA